MPLPQPADVEVLLHREPRSQQAHRAEPGPADRHGRGIGDCGGSDGNGPLDRGTILCMVLVQITRKPAPARSIAQRGVVRIRRPHPTRRRAAGRSISWKSNAVQNDPGGVQPAQPAATAWLIGSIIRDRRSQLMPPSSPILSWALRCLSRRERRGQEPVTSRLKRSGPLEIHRVARLGDALDAGRSG